MKVPERIRAISGFVRGLFVIPQREHIRLNSRDLTFFLKYLRPVMHLAVLCILFNILLSGVKVLYPLTTKILIDNIFLGNDPAGIIQELNTLLPAWMVTQISWIFYSLTALIIAVLLLGVLTVVLQVSISYVTVCFREAYTFHLQTDLFSHVLRFPIAYFRSHQTGYIMSRLTEDVSVLEYIFSQFLPQMLSNITYIIMSVGILFALNTRLTSLVIVLAPLFLVGNFFFVRYIRAVTYEERERRADISKDLQEIITGIESVKVHTAERREYQRLSSALSAAIDTRIRNTMLNSFSQQVRFGTQSLIMLTVLWFGGNAVLAGSMTVGDFVAYTAYIATFAGAMNSLLSFPILLQPAFTSAERIQELFRLTPEADENEGIIPETTEGTITFSDVSFSYQENVPVLSHVTLTLKRGEIYGISGKTGAGKTTLISLILSFYRPDTGTILLDGRDIATLNGTWLREQISVVSQDLFLFNKTIRENILYSRPDATDDDVIAAATRAQIHDEILALPHGYDTVVGERGTQLSVGQRQRISIARAFLKDAPILILDEPTSALDERTEEALIPLLKALSADRTTILISHRPSVLRITDIIYVVKDGTVYMK
ncbi:ABC transporter ATP-binding protein/permease [Methanogenium sp. S4BF]|uniref:ABC transporter ATP-binding protein n=1 Tax=Methanogenium sp. S4BF TaxID=1789226 RepID=UPI002415A70A|nr:ABC transporter ATP-binding protein [Methanogenium sp. S4BF]WFN33513.1 ABC transporter ATP-binding protein/permease [Methanogenium sp. S4BF]